MHTTLLENRALHLNWEKTLSKYHVIALCMLIPTLKIKQRHKQWLVSLQCDQCHASHNTICLLGSEREQWRERSRELRTTSPEAADHQRSTDQA